MTQHEIAQKLALQFVASHSVASSAAEYYNDYKKLMMKSIT